ncbi:MAG: hypothetical protein IPN16_21145 [Gemmatimonadetes bacterium]|nr:hypothetical protein [Gemmatimonadota bacterium]
MTSELLDLDPLAGPAELRGDDEQVGLDEDIREPAPGDISRGHEHFAGAVLAEEGAQREVEIPDRSLVPRRGAGLTSSSPCTSSYRFPSSGNASTSSLV